MDTVITQKKKTPVKHPLKPKDDENGPKKKVFTAAQMKKLVIYEK